MKRRLTFRTAVWTAFAAIALLSLTSGAAAVQQEIKKIRLYDNCEPTSFNAELGPGTCVGNGTQTFDQFIAELIETQTATAWRNQPTFMKVHLGRPTQIENRGGEVHTFTQVGEFGGGLVSDLNNLSGNPVVAPECEDPGTVVFIPAGATLKGPVTGDFQLPLGFHKFQCCIHPWMRTVIQVEPNTTAQVNKSSAATGHHAHH
jgi:hypothetical protein